MSIGDLTFKTAASFFLLFGFSATVHAAEIKGHVYDFLSHEQLVGASVTLRPIEQRKTTALDGGFSFRDLKAGLYTLTITYAGYMELDTTFHLSADAIISVNILLHVNGSLSSVIVSGIKNGGTDEFARKREQTANNMLNIVSANAIALSPDITVANVMQRISGVSIERNGNGDGQYAIIRGMDKRYNTTLVNGVKIPSPDNRNRYVPLDIFPIELLDRVEVIKTLTPDMEADAAGGVINLVMRNAPAHFQVQVNLGTGYSQLYFDRNFSSYPTASINSKSPAEITGPGIYAPISSFPYNNVLVSTQKPPANFIGSLTIGDRFLNNKLGVVFSGSYQNAYRGNNSNSLLQSPTVPPVANDMLPQQPAFSDIYARQYDSRIDRSGVETKIDYNFNPDNSISLFATYLQLNERRTRQTSDSLLGGYSTSDNYVGSYAIYDKTESRSDLQSIFNTTLQGKNKLYQKWFTDWSLVYSNAQRQIPDNAQFSIASAVNPNTNTGTFTISPPVVENQSREWIHNSDQDLSAYLNFHFNTHLYNNTTIISFGGMFRYKERDNYDNAYTLTPVSDSNSNYQQYISIPASKFTFIPSNAALGNAAGNPGIYHFNEDVGGAYGMIKYSIQNTWQIIAGVRVETTHQNYVSSLPVTVEGKTADISYIDPLPSIEVKYSFNPVSALRLAYFKSIFRPAYADLIAFPERGSSNDSYQTQGNPHLQHTVINNFDLRYERFPKGLDEFMLGVFYKIIHNPIEYAFTQNGFGGLILSPNNFGTANNFGVELAFRKYFGSIGISGNYTYTNSVINASKNYYYQSASGQAINTTIYVNRPLQGQSQHIGNFALLYKSTKINLDAQLALVYTGERINTLSLYTGLDNWEKATTNLDFSIQKDFGKHFSFYFKINNILNTPFQLIIKQPNSSYSGKYKLPFQESADYVTVQYDRFYASYLIGIKFKF